jgi:ParB-like nuclease family protein
MSIAHYAVSEIKKSTDYKKFKKLDFQRPISSEHSFRLQKSIQECNLLNANPIIVDKNYYIIDGQHRVDACRILKTPIYYQVIDIDAQAHPNVIININKQENWKLKNYIDFHAKQGNENYIKLLNLTKLYDCPINSLMYLSKLAGGKANHNLREGKMQLPENTEDFLEKFMAFNHHCRDLMEKKYHAVLTSQVWTSAHYHCYNVLGDAYPKFLEQLKKGMPSMIAMRLKDDYLKYFNMHANKGMKNNKFNILEVKTDDEE